MVLNEKLTKNKELRGLKLRGFRRNQITNAYFIYQKGQHNKVNSLEDFENKTPTQMDATHAITKSNRDFQNRIPKELDENFDIPRMSVIN